MKKVLIGCGVLFGLFVLASCGGILWIGLKIDSGEIPDTAVLPGNKLSSAARDSINQVVTLRPDESIQFFYCQDMLDWSADGNLITNQRIISYQQDGELIYFEADFDDIVSLTPNFGEWPDDTSLLVETKEGEVFVLYFADEDDMDHTAIEYAQRRINAP